MKLATLFAVLLLVTASGNSSATPALMAAEVAGEVLEVLDVESYTFVRLKTKQGEAWAAVPTTALRKGAKVTIGNTMVVENFESKSLKRKFEKIVFGSVVDPQTGTAGSTAAPHGAVPVALAIAAKVAKATGPNAKTVAEVVTGKSSLKDKSVLVRGQIVKVTSGIMGKNWFHLQDGTGSSDKGTHDIIVTSQDQAAVGDIVTAKGTVRTDVNIGAGYSYAVLIEDAALNK